jgi:multicomponent Na+:H+ antiporter subunit F
MTDTDLLIGAMLITAVMIGVGLYRVFAGPTVFDRLVAIALLSVNGVILLVFIGFAFDRASLFLDIALAFALLAFLLPIALGRYFEDRDDGTSSDGLPSARSRPRPLGVVPHGLFAERGRRLQEQEAKRRSVGASPMRDRSEQQPGYPGPATTPPAARQRSTGAQPPSASDADDAPDDSTSHGGDA